MLKVSWKARKREVPAEGRMGSHMGCNAVESFAIQGHGWIQTSFKTFE